MNEVEKQGGVVGTEPKAAENKAPNSDKSTISVSRSMIRNVAILVVALVLMPFVATALDLYVFNWQNPTLRKIAFALPYPAVIVGGDRYSVSEYDQELSNLDRILKQNEKTASHAELAKMFMDRVKRAAAVDSLVLEKKINIDETVKMATSLTFGDKASDADKEKSVKDNFNWTIDYFNKRVLYPYARDMAYGLDVLKPKAEELATLVKAPGADFAKIAKEKGEDASKDTGGDLGWFKAGQMVPEFENVVFALKKGEVAGPFASRFGWHVAKLVDERGEGEAKEYKVSHIIISVQGHEADIEPSITEAEKNIKASVLLKE
ncbi:MAG: peptidylprolyl isomerase [bacterium]